MNVVANDTLGENKASLQTKKPLNAYMDILIHLIIHELAVDFKF